MELGAEFIDSELREKRIQYYSKQLNKLHKGRLIFGRLETPWGKLISALQAQIYVALGA